MNICTAFRWKRIALPPAPPMTRKEMTDLEAAVRGEKSPVKVVFGMSRQKTVEEDAR